MSHYAPSRSHMSCDADLPSTVLCSKRQAAQFLAAPNPQTCPQTAPQRVSWLHQKLHANRVLWWCLRMQGKTAMFHGAVKVSANQIGGWRGRESVAESAESRSLIYRFYFAPSFIHCLSPSLSIPSVLFSIPPAPNLLLLSSFTPPSRGHLLLFLFVRPSQLFKLC